MRFERRTRSCCSSSAKRDHSRSAITAGSPASTGRNRCGSVRSPPAATRASRRSSFAPARLTRSRRRSSCLGLIAYTAKPRSRRASTTGPCGTSMATATSPGRRRLTRASRRVPRGPHRHVRTPARPRPCPPHRAGRPGALPSPSRRRRTSGLSCQPWSCPLMSHEPSRRLPEPVLALGARLPTGHPSWPACRGTGPKLVLVARVRNGRSRQAGSHGQLTQALIAPSRSRIQVCNQAVDVRRSLGTFSGDSPPAPTPSGPVTGLAARTADATRYDG